jgi:xylan 1,4-beta-xylosidase
MKTLPIQSYMHSWRSFASTTVIAVLLGEIQTNGQPAAAKASPNILSTAETNNQVWRFTADKPADGWMQAVFNDQGWSQGKAGFGTAGTPNAIVKTEWKTADIWLRREFELPAGKMESLVLRLHHDEDAEVYLNGTLAARLAGFTRDYENFPLGPEALATLKPTRNTIAIHCRQTTGGQYIDAGLIRDIGPQPPPPALPDFHADPHIAKDTYQCQVIDPMVFTDDDGSSYLYFGNANCNVVTLNDDMISFDPAAVKRITPQDYGEGSFVLKRKGVYYLMWSQYDTRDPRYCVSYATSSSPLGPFTNAANNPILVQNGPVKGAGHHSVVQVPGRDQWVIAYHRFHIPGGDGYHRETCLSPMRFDKQGQIEKVNVFEAVASLAPGGDKLPGLRKLMDTPVRDTSICRSRDGTWYLTGTVQPFYGFNEGIKLWRSKDTVAWEPLGFVWKYGASAWHKPYLDKKKSIWAPEVHYLKGTFWLTYSLPGWDGTGKTSGTGLLKSTTGKPEGPYEDMQPNERLGDEIDASLFQDDDGTVYFLWHSGKIAKMKPDMSGLAEPYHWLKTTASDPNPKHHSGLCAGIFGRNSFDHVGYEGMFLFKANGRYYLSCAENFEGRYSCAIATSTNLYGPYSERYEALPHAGHNTFFKDEQGQWWSTYFGSDGNAPWQERPGVLPIEFDGDGRVRAKKP